MRSNYSSSSSSACFPVNNNSSKVSNKNKNLNSSPGNNKLNTSKLSNDGGDVSNNKEDEREDVQKKTFTKWINSILSKDETKKKDCVKDLYNDFRDGSRLLGLLEILTNREFKRERGKMRVHHLNNMSRALTVLEENNVRLVNISANDLVDGNIKITLGLTWNVFMHWQVNESMKELMKTHSNNIEKALLSWCQNNTKDYPGVSIKNFTNSWTDGLAFSALIHRYRPDLISYASISLNEDVNERLLEVFSIIEEHLGIQKLLDIEDLNPKSSSTKKDDEGGEEAEASKRQKLSEETPPKEVEFKVDKKSIIMYVLCIYQVLSKLEAKCSSESDLTSEIETLKKEKISSNSGAISSYASLVEEIMKWLIDADDRLERLLSDNPLEDVSETGGESWPSLSNLKDIFNNHEEFMLSLTEYQINVGDCLHEGMRLIQDLQAEIKSSRDKHLQQFVDEQTESIKEQMRLINGRWEDLRMKSMTRQNLIHRVLMKSQQEELNKISEFIKRIEYKITAEIKPEFKPNFQMNNFEKMKTELEKQSELQKVLNEEIELQKSNVSKLSNMILVDNTAEKSGSRETLNDEDNFQNLEDQLYGLSERWLNILNWTDLFGKLVNDILLDEEIGLNFYENYYNVNKELNEIETELKNFEANINFTPPPGKSKDPEKNMQIMDFYLRMKDLREVMEKRLLDDINIHLHDKLNAIYKKAEDLNTNQDKLKSDKINPSSESRVNPSELLGLKNLTQDLVRRSDFEGLIENLSDKLEALLEILQTMSIRMSKYGIDFNKMSASTSKEKRPIVPEKPKSFKKAKQSPTKNKEDFETTRKKEEPKEAIDFIDIVSLSKTETTSDNVSIQELPKKCENEPNQNEHAEKVYKELKHEEYVEDFKKMNDFDQKNFKILLEVEANLIENLPDSLSYNEETIYFTEMNNEYQEIYSKFLKNLEQSKKEDFLFTVKSEDDLNSLKNKYENMGKILKAKLDKLNQAKSDKDIQEKFDSIENSILKPHRIYKESLDLQNLKFMTREVLKGRLHEIKLKLKSLRSLEANKINEIKLPEEGAKTQTMAKMDSINQEFNSFDKLYAELITKIKSELEKSNEERDKSFNVKFEESFSSLKAELEAIEEGCQSVDINEMLKNYEKFEIFKKEKLDKISSSFFGGASEDDEHCIKFDAFVTETFLKKNDELKEACDNLQKLHEELTGLENWLEDVEIYLISDEPKFGFTDLLEKQVEQTLELAKDIRSLTPKKEFIILKATESFNKYFPKYIDKNFRNKLNHRVGKLKRNWKEIIEMQFVEKSSNIKSISDKSAKLLNNFGHIKSLLEKNNPIFNETFSVNVQFSTSPSSQNEKDVKPESQRKNKDGIESITKSNQIKEIKAPIDLSRELRKFKEFFLSNPDFNEIKTHFDNLSVFITENGKHIKIQEFFDEEGNCVEDLFESWKEQFENFHRYIGNEYENLKLGLDSYGEFRSLMALELDSMDKFERNYLYGNEDDSKDVLDLELISQEQDEIEEFITGKNEMNKKAIESIGLKLIGMDILKEIIEKDLTILNGRRDKILTKARELSEEIKCNLDVTNKIEFQLTEINILLDEQSLDEDMTENLHDNTNLEEKIKIKLEDLDDHLRKLGEKTPKYKNSIERLHNQIDLLKNKAAEVSKIKAAIALKSSSSSEDEKLCDEIDKIEQNLESIWRILRQIEQNLCFLELISDDPNGIKCQLDKCTDEYTRLSNIKSEVEGIIKEGRRFINVENKRITETSPNEFTRKELGKLNSELDSIKGLYNKLGLQIAKTRSSLENGLRLTIEINEYHDAVESFNKSVSEFINENEKREANEINRDFITRTIPAFSHNQKLLQKLETNQFKLIQLTDSQSLTENLKTKFLNLNTNLKTNYKNISKLLSLTFKMSENETDKSLEEAAKEVSQFYEKIDEMSCSNDLSDLNDLNDKYYSELKFNYLLALVAIDFYTKPDSTDLNFLTAFKSGNYELISKTEFKLDELNAKLEAIQNLDDGMNDFELQLDDEELSIEDPFIETPRDSSSAANKKDPGNYFVNYAFNDEDLDEDMDEEVTTVSEATTIIEKSRSDPTVTTTEKSDPIIVSKLETPPEKPPRNIIEKSPEKEKDLSTNILEIISIDSNEMIQGILRMEPKKHKQEEKEKNMGVSIKKLNSEIKTILVKLNDKKFISTSGKSDENLSELRLEVAERLSEASSLLIKLNSSAYKPQAGNLIGDLKTELKTNYDNLERQWNLFFNKSKIIAKEKEAAATVLKPSTKTNVKSSSTPPTSNTSSGTKTSKSKEFKEHGFMPDKPNFDLTKMKILNKTSVISLNEWFEEVEEVIRSIDENENRNMSQSEQELRDEISLLKTHEHSLPTKVYQLNQLINQIRSSNSNQVLLEYLEKLAEAITKAKLGGRLERVRKLKETKLAKLRKLNTRLDLNCSFLLELRAQIVSIKNRLSGGKDEKFSNEKKLALSNVVERLNSREEDILNDLAYFHYNLIGQTNDTSDDPLLHFQIKQMKDDYMYIKSYLNDSRPASVEEFFNINSFLEQFAEKQKKKAEEEEAAKEEEEEEEERLKKEDEKSSSTTKEIEGGEKSKETADFGRAQKLFEELEEEIMKIGQRNNEVVSGSLRSVTGEKGQSAQREIVLIGELESIEKAIQRQKKLQDDLQTKKGQLDDLLNQTINNTEIHPSELDSRSALHTKVTNLLTQWNKTNKIVNERYEELLALKNESISYLDFHNEINQNEFFFQKEPTAHDDSVNSSSNNKNTLRNENYLKRVKLKNFRELTQYLIEKYSNDDPKKLLINLENIEAKIKKFGLSLSESHEETHPGAVVKESYSGGTLQNSASNSHNTLTHTNNNSNNNNNEKINSELIIRRREIKEWIVTLKIRYESHSLHSKIHSTEELNYKLSEYVRLMNEIEDFYGNNQGRINDLLDDEYLKNDLGYMRNEILNGIRILETTLMEHKKMEDLVDDVNARLASTEAIKTRWNYIINSKTLESGKSKDYDSNNLLLLDQMKTFQEHMKSTHRAIFKANEFYKELMIKSKTVNVGHINTNPINQVIEQRLSEINKRFNFLTKKENSNENGNGNDELLLNFDNFIIHNINFNQNEANLDSEDHRQLASKRNTGNTPEANNFQENTVVELPWERNLFNVNPGNSSGPFVPYYANHQQEITQWDHPKMALLTKKLADFNDVKFSAYRTALKLRAIQRELSLDFVPLSNVKKTIENLGLMYNNEKLLDIQDIQSCLTLIFKSITNINQIVSNKALKIELILNHILNVYDIERAGLIRNLSFKVLLVLLCKGSMEDKFRYLFSIIAINKENVVKKGDSNKSSTIKVADQRKLGLLLHDCIQIVKQLGEVAAFGGSNIEPSVRSCFLINENDPQETQYIQVTRFVEWIRREPQSLVWLPVLHRIAASEKAVHQAKCNICKVVPIVGLRYRCLKCFNFDMCQKCFFGGKFAPGPGGSLPKNSKNHKLSHPMQEYCVESTSTEDVRDFTRSLKNRFFKSKSSLLKKRKLGYLPVQSVLEGDMLESPTPANNAHSNLLSPSYHSADEDEMPKSFSSGGGGGSIRKSLRGGRKNHFNTSINGGPLTHSGSVDLEASLQSDHLKSLSPASNMLLFRSNSTPDSEDEHSLIAHYCQSISTLTHGLHHFGKTSGGHSYTTNGGGYASDGGSSSQILLTRSPLQIISSIDQEECEQLNTIIQALEKENANLQAEYSRLKTKDNVNVGTMEKQDKGNYESTNFKKNDKYESDDESSRKDLSEQARQLRTHKDVLESRMQILEDHNRQLEIQLDKLRKILQIQESNNSRGGGHYDEGNGLNYYDNNKLPQQQTNNTGTLQSKSIVASEYLDYGSSGNDYDYYGNYTNSYGNIKPKGGAAKDDKPFKGRKQDGKSGELEQIERPPPPQFYHQNSSKFGMDDHDDKNMDPYGNRQPIGGGNKQKVDDLLSRCGDLGKLVTDLVSAMTDDEDEEENNGHNNKLNKK